MKGDDYYYYYYYYEAEIRLRPERCDPFAFWQFVTDRCVIMLSELPEPLRVEPGLR